MIENCRNKNSEIQKPGPYNENPESVSKVKGDKDEKRKPLMDTERSLHNDANEIKSRDVIDGSHEGIYSLEGVDNANVSHGFVDGNFVDKNPDDSLSFKIKNTLCISLSGQSDQNPHDPLVDDIEVTKDVRFETKSNYDTCSPNNNHIYNFSTPPALYKEKRLYECNDCGKIFPHKSRLLLHQKTHTGEKPFQCTECGKKVMTRQKLIVHQRIHTGERPFKCSECGKQFSCKGYLIEHFKRHTGLRPHMCHLCGKQFTFKSSLVIHLQSHSGEKPHRCTECGKNFNYMSRLLVHQRTHTGVKPHVCHRCGKHFDYKSQLTRHEKTHSVVAAL
ncbi:zinc finger protein 37-like [Pelobates fuscus]|uniref:zinc finger protein 37-like n=1 Tax=Pelobates fuscus TaxID=191477 RepID=UPI002FE4C3DE